MHVCLIVLCGHRGGFSPDSTGGSGGIPARLLPPSTQTLSRQDSDSSVASGRPLLPYEQGGSRPLMYSCHVACGGSRVHGRTQAPASTCCLCSSLTSYLCASRVLWFQMPLECVSLNDPVEATEIGHLVVSYAGAFTITADVRAQSSTLGPRNGSGAVDIDNDEALAATSRFYSGAVPPSAFEQVTAA